MSRILLLVDHEENRRLLVQELARQYQVCLPDRLEAIGPIGTLAAVADLQEGENLSIASETFSANGSLSPSHKETPLQRRDSGNLARNLGENASILEGEHLSVGTDSSPVRRRNSRVSKGVRDPGKSETNQGRIHGESVLPTSTLFDLCILDVSAFERNKAGLEAQKAASESFLPVLLHCDRAFLARIAHPDKLIVDDVLAGDIEPVELSWRVESLLTRRRQELLSPVKATPLSNKPPAASRKAPSGGENPTDETPAPIDRSLLSQNEEHFSALVEGVRDYAIFMLDNAGKVMSWNVGAERILGYSATEILGKHFSCFYPTQDIECGKLEQELRMVATAGQCEDEGIRVRKDGSQFWANVLIAQLRDRFGQQVGFSAITHDLSDRKQIEEELCSVNRALRTICDCNQALVRSSEESELLQEICRIIVEIGRYRACCVSFTDSANDPNATTVTERAIEYYPEFLRPNGSQKSEFTSWFSETAIRAGLPCVAKISIPERDSDTLATATFYKVSLSGRERYPYKPQNSHNILKDPHLTSLRHEAIAGGYASILALPLQRTGDWEDEHSRKTNPSTPHPPSSIPQSFGVLIIYAAEPDAFEVEEVRLLKELADDLAYGIVALRTKHERSLAMSALQESEERYRRLVELSPEAIVVHSQGKIDFINTAGARLLGAANPEQLIGFPVINFVHPNCREIVERGINKLVEEKRLVPFMEQTLIRLDGAEVSVESAATPFTYQGNPAVLLVARDLTERKRMEKALRHSEELHRLTLSYISEAVFIADLKGNLTYICPNVDLVFGYSMQEVILVGHIAGLLGKNLFDWNELEKLGEIHNIEREITRKGGEKATLLVSVKRVSINGGTVLYTCRDISDRVSAESALKQSEERLRKVLETLPVGVVFTDGKGQILEANPASEKIWAGVRYVGIEQYSEYKGWWADTGEAIASEEWALARALNKGEISINEVIDIEAFDGTRKTILNSAVLLRNPAQEITGGIVVNQDITELRQMQNALQESNRKIVNILESITDAFLAVDRHWQLTYLNRQAEQILQKQREELLGKNIWEVFPKTVGSLFFEQYRRAVSTGVAVSFEGFYEPLNSWFEVHAYPTEEGLTIYFQDVTERKQAQEALIESAHQLRAVFEGAIDTMAIADDTGKYIAVNSAASVLFGLSPTELIGHEIAEFIADADFDFEQVWGIFKERGRFNGEYLFRRWDGTLRQIEFSAVANFLPGRHLSVLRDITERKRAEQELKQYREQLEELVKARTLALTRSNEQLQQEIRQRARVEAALRASEEQLRTLINATPDIICFKDGAGRWQEANQAVLQLFQLQGVHYRGLKDSQLANYSSFYRDAFLNWEQTDELAWRNKTLLSSEEVIRQPDGTAKIYDVIKVPLFRTNGMRKGLVVLGRDITHRVNAEEELNRLASIVESSDDAIVGHTLDGIIISWNAGAEQIYGYSAMDVKGQSSSILSPPDHRDELPQILERVKQGGRLEHYETIRLKKDGQKIDVALTISPIFDAAGRITGVATIARDISDRKRIEAALERLRHQNELILNSAGEGICGLDARGKIKFVNPAASRMLGYEVRELLGQSMHGLLHHSHSDKTNYPIEACPIHASLQDGSVHHVGDEVFWCKTGSCFPVEYLSTPILEGGKIVGAVVTFKDITERLAVERMKDEFISIVSHELRTPLTSIRGSMGLLAGGILDSQPEKAKRMLEIAVTNTDRLVRLINDILDLERIQSGKVTMERQLCNAADLMTQAADTMRTMAERAGVTLSVTPIDVQLRADPDRLIQTLTNLLSNAIKFSLPGTTVWLTGEIRQQMEGSSAKAEGKRQIAPSALPPSPYPPLSFSLHPSLTHQYWLEIAVKDRGRGIPADKLETIFERFQQVDSSDARQKGGTGLGLAICRTIVQQHGGHIWAENNQDEGTCFCFTLPIQAMDAAAIKPLVLIADDATPSIRSNVRALLEQQGYRAIPVASAQEALERCKGQLSAVILLDLSLFGMNGWETLVTLKNREDPQEIPIILFSDLAQTLEKAKRDKSEPEILQIKARLSPSATQLARSPARILIVEDEGDLAHFLTTTFEGYGIETARATTGQQALQLCQNWTPDLLILNLILPTGDGFAVIDWLRQRERLGELPVIVYTALDLDKSEREPLKLGQTPFVTKTRITPTEFEGRVLEVLNRIVITREVDENRGS